MGEETSGYPDIMARGCESCERQLVTTFYGWYKETAEVHLGLLLEGEMLQALLDVCPKDHPYLLTLKMAPRWCYGRTPLPTGKRGKAGGVVCKPFNLMETSLEQALGERAWSR